MNWSSEQEGALAAVAQWLEDPKDNVFRLFGYAGTGKTTLAKSFADKLNGLVLYGAFTGKAALVMQRKGCLSATTIHRMIYLPKDKSRARLFELEAEFAEEQNADRQRALQELIQAEKAQLRKPLFGINAESEVKEAQLVIIDEVSMVGRQMGEDLLSFGTPVLVLGDPAQLPPVADMGYFTDREPDVMLRQVHRQAEGSPIIALATKVRNGQFLPLGQWGESAVVNKKDLTIQQAAKFDQVIVGTNRMRRMLNRRIRDEVLGRKSHLPEVGDKLICLRNNHELGLLNGSQWTVLDSQIRDDDFLNLTLREFGRDDATMFEVIAHRTHFEDREIPFWSRKDAEEFDFGYAITCHKSQGSQWDSVVVVDESSVFRNHAQQWLYTAITRAANKVTIVK